MATINGTNKADELVGTAKSDVISGFFGDDNLVGEGGNDKLYGGDGKDDIFGGDGLDKIFGGFDADFIHGESGADVIQGEQGNDELYGDDGQDIIYGGTGYDNIYGGSDNDQLHGGERGDSLVGDSGNDQLFGDGDTDWLDGGSGNDLLDGGNTIDPSGPDFSWDEDAVAFRSAETGVVVNFATGKAEDGQGGTDTLIDIEIVEGTQFDDVLTGGNAANDDFEQFTGGEGDDVIDGGSGFDVAMYGRLIDEFGFPTFAPIIADLAAQTVIDEGGDTDTLINIECVQATMRDDRLYGSDRSEEFRPGLGNDEIDGRGGVDTVSYSFAAPGYLSRGVEVDLRTGMVIDMSGFFDQLTSIESIVGGRGGDAIRGDKRDNRLNGYDGDDLIKGGSGVDNLLGGKGGDHLDGGGLGDRLDGGEGNDTLRGGAGADTFDFGVDSDEDHILDFVTGFDKLDVSALGFASAADVMAKFKILSPSAAMLTLSEDNYVIFDYVNTASAVLAVGDIIV